MSNYVIIGDAASNVNQSLKERFNNYTGKNLAKEFEWDESVGNEIW